MGDTHMSDCIFCSIVDGIIPANKLYEDDTIVAFTDVNPAAPTHILVIPKKHIATLTDADEADAELLGRIVLVAKKLAVDEGLGESGYRIVTNVMAGAGQSVFHIHFHVLGGRAFSWPPG